MRRFPTRLSILASAAAFVAAAWPTSASRAEPATKPVYNATIGDRAYDYAKWSSFWSFRPIVKPPIPAKADNPIDAFVDAKLKENGLEPAPEADKATLIRRATFDLTGLPPTVEEVRAFLADQSPDAYEKLIDRLLASPHYGERWGRHWLDVARYVPGRISYPGTKGTAPDSHFRDYVVRSFNADKPYDRFVTEQLAGDLLPPAKDRKSYFDQIVAPAFLSLGPWFDMDTDPNRLRLEMVDEQINTATKAFLGLNIACARCHDHKTDPVPTQDYYGLGGIFRSTRIVGDFSENWRDGRVRSLRPLASPDEVAANDAIRAKITAIREARWNQLKARHAELSARWHADEARYRAAAKLVPAPWVLAFEAEEFDGQDNLRIAQIRKGDQATDVIETQTPGMQWVRYRVEVPDTGTYQLEALHSTGDRTPLNVTSNGDTVADAGLAEPTGGADTLYQRWDVVVPSFDLRTGSNFLRLNAKDGNFPRIDRLRLIKLEPATTEKLKSVAAGQKLDAVLLERFVVAPQDPWPTVADVEHFLGAEERAALAAMTSEAEQLTATIKPYPLAVSVTDQREPVDLPVYVRGNTYKTSDYLVPRGLPRFLDHALPRPKIAPGSSGRLELAQWLTDPRHPLTARVMANRIWAWHFGRGIVETTSDFGFTGSKPSNPELLDWLAATFVEDGWSIKRLHRLIMTSAAYRRAGGASSESDPENRYLSHFPRRRLDAEELYDSMLSATNALPRQPSGAPLEQPKSGNRAMYTLINGRSPKGMTPDVKKMLALFDADFSGAPVALRPTSATPAQSLFWLNSPLVKFYADGFAARLLKMDKLTDAKRVEQMYLIATGRPPTKELAAASLAFVEQAEQDGDAKPAAWSKLCQAVFAGSEFRYVD